MPTAKKTTLSPDQEALATRYVLGELSGEETASFEALYSANEDFRRGYNDWAAALDAKAVAGSDQSNLGVIDRFRMTWEQGPFIKLLGKLGVVPAVTGAFVAALLVVLVTNFGLLEVGPSDVPLFTDLLSENGELVAQISFDPTTGQIVFELGELSSPADETLEVWLRTQSAVPVSLGTLDVVAGQAFLEVSHPNVELLEAEISMTLEPQGGAGAAGPTGDEIGRGILQPD